ncbi:MAG: signal peptidase II [Chloroflexota bacterium]
MKRVATRPIAPMDAAHLGRLVPLVALAATVVVTDQLSKAIAVHALTKGRIVPVAGGLVQLNLTLNTGAAFGLFRQAGDVFVAIALAVVLVLVVLHRRVSMMSTASRLALGLIAGGATGNALDRVRLGYVVDFVDFRWWPVFNLADSAIVLGTLAIAWLSARLERDGDDG